ncbi:hypothetical protein [Paludisphaera mucosa]|uniref:Uncharacterized protein n=1 Tax=Paludisphaera mucosa TaxID=3030827 RepID=A0ABT6FB39_9BACT|nr:hypothetical protein [Paludisphaera mucosa]MDG3004808.1 hypothetical protein [Paludisphaera mucosa]
MNTAVELHDSTLAGMTHDGRDLVLRLSPAYVHRSTGRPGVDPGSGWLQDVDLVIFEAMVDTLPSEFPVDLSDGSFSVGEVLWDNSIPLPLAVTGAVTLTAVTCGGEFLTVRGTGASTVMHGESRYFEQFPGSADG